MDALSGSHSLGDSYSQCRAVFVGDFISQCIKQLHFHWLSSSYSLILRMTALANQAFGSGAAAPALSAGQLSQVLTSVKDCLRDEMQSLKRELSQERETAEDRLVKRMRMEKGPSFKKKSHEKQFQFNSTVMDKMEATAALQQTPPAVEKAKTSLEEGMTSLKTRQKHIRIADRSEYGWAAVEEYVEDELADGEDDEKRVQRADFRAGKKLKSVKGAKNKKGSGLQSGKKPQHANAQAGRGPSTNGTMAQLIAALLPTIDKMSGSSSGIQARGVARILEKKGQDCAQRKFLDRKPHPLIKSRAPFCAL